ncbi:hypothetical protein NDU88_004945 [Pleurodeles waltl]|uniref:Uncharacterized protein n=1 Tax=Pleurodeles waltl TaxID=8319 RepID=A0AAV7QFW9_PLEWA|nr:hypothetical protein NDU88_004945 [Pleurodeles waltl]
MAAQQAAPLWGFRAPYRHPVLGGCGRQEENGGMGCRGAPGGPTKIFSVCHADTENRDGCNCTVAPLPLRRLHSEPASLWKGVSHWAGGRPSRGRPPAQRETQNTRGGLLTAQRYSGGPRQAGGYRRRPGSE